MGTAETRSSPGTPAAISRTLQETKSPSSEVCTVCGGKGEAQFHQETVDCPRCRPDPNPKDLDYRVTYTEGPVHTDWYQHKYFRFFITAWLFAKAWTLRHTLGEAYVQRREL